MDRTIFAFGDIHGYRDLLCEKIDAARASPYFGADSEFVFLGDYVDRGPDSAGVIDKLIEMQAGEHTTICLTGNHELAMRRFLDEPGTLLHWLDWGGGATIASYGVGTPRRALGRPVSWAMRDRLAEAMPPGHLPFLQNLPVSHVRGKYLFVHAGIRPGVAFAEQTDTDMTMIRQPFLAHPGPHSHYVVHGHTPVDEPEILAHRANIDTCAYETGRLTCLAITEKGKFVV
ncbi:MAG: serine/threonine protein phosphatase [Alphaproteobacteria bacterium]|nr:serine/threonine protein phosphatase [Alphaproteobacteria bacterium]